MKDNVPKDLERYRVISGPLASDLSFGFNGAFIVQYGTVSLTIITSDGIHWVDLGLPYPAWEHVSVSTPKRCPTWDEMCYIKDIFWDEEETVTQLHIPKSEHINCHPHCLHLWKPIGVEVIRPPSITVGTNVLKSIEVDK